MKTKRRIGDIKPLVTQPMVFRNALLTLQTLGHPAPNQTLYLLVKSFDVQFPDFLVSRLLVDCNHFECQRLLQPRPLGDQIWTSSELLCLCIIFLSCHGTFQINDLTFCIFKSQSEVVYEKSSIFVYVHANFEQFHINEKLSTLEISKSRLPYISSPCFSWSAAAAVGIIRNVQS